LIYIAKGFAAVGLLFLAILLAVSALELLIQCWQWRRRVNRSLCEHLRVRGPKI
jgi:hypothetical protein